MSWSVHTQGPLVSSTVNLQLRNARSRFRSHVAADYRKSLPHSTESFAMCCKQLWRELQAQGYQGGARAVYRFLAQLKQGSALSGGKSPPITSRFRRPRSHNGQPNKRCGGLSVTRPI